jgi:hypothetical protein
MFLLLSFNFRFCLYQCIDPNGYACGCTIAFGCDDCNRRLLYFLNVRVSDVLVRRDENTFALVAMLNDARVFSMSNSEENYKLAERFERC